MEISKKTLYLLPFLSDLMVSKNWGATPCDGLYREGPPKRGILFRLEVYERVGISLVEVYKRVKKSVI